MIQQYYFFQGAALNKTTAALSKTTMSDKKNDRCGISKGVARQTLTLLDMEVKSSYKVTKKQP